MRACEQAERLLVRMSLCGAIENLVCCLAGARSGERREAAAAINVLGEPRETSASTVVRDQPRP